MLILLLLHWLWVSILANYCSRMCGKTSDSPPPLTRRFQFKITEMHTHTHRCKEIAQCYPSIVLPHECFSLISILLFSLSVSNGSTWKCTRGKTHMLHFRKRNKNIHNRTRKTKWRKSSTRAFRIHQLTLCNNKHGFGNVLTNKNWT